MKPFSFLRTTHLRPDDLTRLAAHDLPERRIKAVRRHLASCSACRTEWQAVQVIWQNVKAFQMDPPTSDGLRERVWNALPPTPPLPERKLTMPVVFVRPVVGASIAAFAVAAVLGGSLLYVPALVLRAPRAVAFADVENAMADIKTATWTETFSITRTLPPKKDQPAKSRLIHRRTEIKNFMQASPPRIASLSRTTAYPPSEETVMKKPTKNIYDGKSSVTFTEGGFNYSKSEEQNQNGNTFQNGEEMVRLAVLFPRDVLNGGSARPNELPSPAKNAMRTIEQSPWSSAPDTLNGKAVLRFHKQVVSAYSSAKQSPRPEKLIRETTVWADPATYRIVKREFHTWHKWQDGRDELDIKTTCDDYRYNVDLPHDIFDVPTPPVGQPFIFHTYHYNNAASKSYISYANLPRSVPSEDQAKIKNVIEQAGRFWSNKQTDQLIALCDFGFNGVNYEWSGNKPYTPAQTADEEKQFRAWVLKGEPYQSWKLQNLTIAQESTGGVYVREKESDPFPPTDRPLNYSATCDVLAVLKPGTKPVPCSITVTLHRSGDDFRITSLNEMYRRQMGIGNGLRWLPRPGAKH